MVAVPPAESQAPEVTGACAHCGTPVEGSPFCCNGCAGAWELIHGAGLENYYDRRETPGPRPVASRTSWAHVPVITAPDGSAAITLQVDGLRCASCVWLSERVLGQTPGVKEAMVSYATGRAQLRWDPQQVDLAALCERLTKLGYQPRVPGESAVPDRDLLLRLGIAAFGASNVMLMSASIYAGWMDGMDPAYASLFRWVALVVATPVALWSAAPFYHSAWEGIKARMLSVDLPVSVGVIVMYVHALWAARQGEDGYLDSMTMLVALLLAGRLLEQRGRRRTAEAATSLAATVPRTVRRENGETVPTESILPGDRLVLGAGEEVGADGRIVIGTGLIQSALLTGESEPVPVGPGDAVVAGAVVMDGALTMVVDATGPDTVLARMAGGLASAMDRPIPRVLTDRIAPWFSVVALIAGAVGGWLHGIPGAVAVLVVACPCALALASPLAVAAGLGAAARRGLLIRSGAALDQLNAVSVVALDKTGTLTRGEPDVVHAADDILRIAAGLGRQSAHPVSRAIVTEAIRRHIPLPAGEAVQEEVGVGLTGRVDGHTWRLRRGGPGEVCLTREDGLSGLIQLADVPRADAAKTVAALRARGLRVVLLTGDHTAVAQRIGAATGVDEIYAELRPEQKVAWIQAEQQKGRKVLFVGDGLNDGPALAAADVGIAMGTGVASSLLAADAVVARDGLGPVQAGLAAATAAARAVRTNIRASLTYNLLAVSAALAGLVNPLVAALLMPLSSSMVLYRALRVDKEVS